MGQEPGNAEAGPLDPRTTRAALRALPVTGFLPGGLLRRLARSGDLLRIPAGTVLTGEGEPGHQAFVVVDGRAETTLGGAWLALSGPGDVVGALAMLDEDARNVEVCAITPMTVVAIGRAGLEALLTHAPVAHLVAQQLARLLGRVVAVQAKAAPTAP